MDFPRNLFVTILAASGFLFSVGHGQVRIPAKHRQILQVTTKSWDASTGTLLRLERKITGKWNAVGKPIPVSVGRSGLGWGHGIHKTTGSGPVKTEGDGKAPSGIFTLGAAFGYDKKAPKNCRLPYRQATILDFYVDDVTSPDYNQWIHLRGGAPEADSRWQRYEKMKRPDDLYELGIIVNHNMTPTIPGGGSAIFIHLWSDPGKPTAGCTAMSRDNLKMLLSWLDPNSHPVLIQAPEGIYKIVR